MTTLKYLGSILLCIIVCYVVVTVLFLTYYAQHYIHEIFVPHSIPSWQDCYNHKSDSFIKHDDQHVNKSTDNNHLICCNFPFINAYSYVNPSYYAGVLSLMLSVIMLKIMLA